MKNTSIHTDYAMNLVQFCQIFESGGLRSPAYMSSQFIKVPPSANSGFRARLIELQEWAHTFEKSLSQED